MKQKGNIDDQIQVDRERERLCVSVFACEWTGSLLWES